QPGGRRGIGDNGKDHRPEGVGLKPVYTVLYLSYWVSDRWVGIEFTCGIGLALTATRISSLEGGVRPRSFGADGGCN
ncbi:MAG: hypothetical protein IID12_09610, partial [Candidatus Marinimicrobia bacterium]|nr:hypothetical protein [Candidatus Neomarinimicrobiota bacterium]